MNVKEKLKLRKERIILLIVFLIVILLVVIYFNYINKHKEREVKLKELFHQKINEPEQLSVLQIVVKNQSDFEKYLKDYNIKKMDYNINWDKEFVLITYPYSIGKCTYQLCNMRENIYPLDILYKKTQVSMIYIYAVRGVGFSTWDVMGFNEKMKFE